MTSLFYFWRFTMQILMAFLFGCTLTYLLTVISSSIRASAILEEACASFALLMIMAAETNAEQAEYLIANNDLTGKEAEQLRIKNSQAFEGYANRKIQIINNNIPTAHKNIIRFKNVDEMKLYVVELLRKQNRRR